jgi:hypothetical protein
MSQRVELRVKQGELLDVCFIHESADRPAVIVWRNRAFVFHHTAAACSETCANPVAATLIYYEVPAVFF